MQGRQIAIVIVAGIAAFAVAFGAGKAMGGGESTAAVDEGETVTLEAVEVGAAKVSGVDTGGTLASFKPEKKEPKPKPSGSTTSPAPAATAAPTTSAPAPAPTQAPAPVVTAAPPPPPPPSTTGGGNNSGGGSGGGVTGGGSD